MDFIWYEFQRIKYFITNNSKAELNAPHDLLICDKQSQIKDLPSKAGLGLPYCIWMTETQFAVLSSVYILAGFIGAITAGPGSSSYGRLLAMRISSIFFIIGSLLEMIATSVLIMSTGRFLVGIGAGVSTVVTPLYISEISPPKAKGLFGTMTQVMICLGILTSESLGYVFDREGQWRIILGFGAGIGFIDAIGLTFIPESPIWLASNMNYKHAVKILRRIRGADNLLDEIAGWNVRKDTLTEEDPLLSPQTAKTSRPKKSNEPGLRDPRSKSLSQIGFLDVLRDPHYRPAIIAVIGIMFAQQLSGINSINMYSVSLLRGLLPISSLLLTILISLMNVITTILCAPLPDWLGRKFCLLMSIIGMGAMSLLLAISLISGIKLLSALAVVLFVGFFATGLGPVPFMMASELVGQEAVGATQSWCLAGNYLSSYIVAQFFPLVNSWLNSILGGVGWVFFVFTAMAVVSWTFVTYFVPETKSKNRSVEI